MIYGCFVKYQAQGWQFIELANDDEDRKFFENAAKKMIDFPLLGDQPIDYKVVELD